MLFLVLVVTPDLDMLNPKSMNFDYSISEKTVYVVLWSLIFTIITIAIIDIIITTTTTTTYTLG